MNDSTGKTAPDLRAIKTAAKNEFAHIAGINGFGIGDRVLKIYIENGEVCRHLPEKYRGVPIEYIVAATTMQQRLG